MASTIITKYGSGAPLASDVVRGELAVDTENKRLYTENSSGSVVELGTNPAANVTFGDNVKAIFGAGSDLQIYHDGSDSFITDNGTGDLKISGEAQIKLGNVAGEFYATFNNNSSVNLYYDNSQKLATTATGIDVTGTAVTDGVTVAGNLSVDSGTIKLDGNYPVGTDNVALGDEALDDGSLSGGNNTAIGARALTANTTGAQNTAVGRGVMVTNSSGLNNTGMGHDALALNTSGGNNTAIGRGALQVNTTASYNTAVGYQALTANTTGDLHVAIGDNALASNTTGRYSVAVGRNASNSQTTANGTIAVGYRALEANTTGENVAVGTNSLLANTTASNNTAVGLYTMQNNTTGAQNTAVGSFALDSNTTASNNTAVGYQSLYSSTTGDKNTAFGYLAGYSVTTGSGNTFVGGSDSGGANPAGYSVTTATNNSFFGSGAGGVVTTGSKNTIIGSYNGNEGGLDIRTLNNHIVLSDGDGNPKGYFDATNWYFPSMYSQTTGSAVNLNVGSTGVVRRSTSSLRYKNTVNDATHGLTELLALRPVTYKGNNDGDTIFGGLIAEEVHDAGLTEFVQYDAEGRPDALAYGNMVSLCIKAIQELSAQNAGLTARIEALESN